MEDLISLFTSKPKTDLDENDTLMMNDEELMMNNEELMMYGAEDEKNNAFANQLESEFIF